MGWTPWSKHMGEARDNRTGAWAGQVVTVALTTARRCHPLQGPVSDVLTPTPQPLHVPFQPVPTQHPAYSQRSTHI